METPTAGRYTRREAFYFKNTLLCLVKSLEKRYTTVDLRNETCVTGKITEVDGYMNITISDAALYDTDGQYQYFPLLHIQGRNIRNVHIPDNVNVIKSIKGQVEVQQRNVKKKRTFKESRAMKQQKETLEMIKEMKKQQGSTKE